MYGAQGLHWHVVYWPTWVLCYHAEAASESTEPVGSAEPPKPEQEPTQKWSGPPSPTEAVPKGWRQGGGTSEGKKNRKRNSKDTPKCSEEGGTAASAQALSAKEAGTSQTATEERSGRLSLKMPEQQTSQAA